MEPVLKSFSRGEVIFKSGAVGNSAYAVKQGQVEISIESDGKRIVLDKIGPGGGFGETTAILGGRRTAQAVALEHTQAFVIEGSHLSALIKKSNPIVRAIMTSLIKRVKKLNKYALNGSKVVPDMVAVTHILKMKIDAVVAVGAGGGKGGSRGRGGADQGLSISYKESVNDITNILGLLTHQVEAILEQMTKFNLLKLEGGKGDGAMITFASANIQETVAQLSPELINSINVGLQQEYDLIELTPLAQMLGVDKDKMYKKMAQGELPESLFVFKKAVALRLVEEKGKAFFEKRRIKKPEDFDDITDIEFVDKDTLQKVFNQIDPYSVAKLLKGVDALIEKKIVSCFSSRKRDVIDQTARNIDEVDDVEVAQITEEVIQKIQEIKLNK
jgi:hypothetical protein